MKRYLATPAADRRFDLVMTVALAAMAIFEYAVFADLYSEASLTASREPDAALLALTVLQIVPLLARRSHPIIVVTLTHAFFVAITALDYQPASAGQFALLISFYTVAIATTPKRADRARLAVLAAMVAWMTAGIVTDDIPAGLLPIIVVLYIGVWVIGNTARARIQNQVLLEERAQRAEQRKTEEADEAVRVERARIARELHDVVAHSLTVMTVQAAGAARVIDTDADQAAGSLRMIEQTGRQALGEMRRMIGVMRGDEHSPRLRPQPGVDTVDELVDAMGESGLAVTWDRQPLPQLPTGLDLTVYRIVQEALTNTMRHGGPGATAQLTIAQDNGDVVVAVRDDGRGAAADDEGGHGLVGMAERVALFDGHLRAGPAPGGGFLVRARLPLQDAT